MKRIEFLIQIILIQIFFLISLSSKAAITECRTCGLMEWGSALITYLTVFGIVAIVLMGVFIMFKKLQERYHFKHHHQH